VQRNDLLKHWNDAWTGGLWYAPWGKALDDLTPQQAAWSPATASASASAGGAASQPKRHSVWQIVNHMIFWREHALRSLIGDKPSPQEVERRNFELPPAKPTAEAWESTRRRFAEAQQQVRDAIADPKNSLDRLQYLIPHDSYHIGQIMYVRAMLGLKPIE